MLKLLWRLCFLVILFFMDGNFAISSISPRGPDIPLSDNPVARDLPCSNVLHAVLALRKAEKNQETELKSESLTYSRYYPFAYIEHYLRLGGQPGFNSLHLAAVTDYSPEAHDLINSISNFIQAQGIHEEKNRPAFKAWRSYQAELVAIAMWFVSGQPATVEQSRESRALLSVFTELFKDQSLSEADIRAVIALHDQEEKGFKKYSVDEEKFPSHFLKTLLFKAPENLRPKMYDCARDSGYFD